MIYGHWRNMGTSEWICLITAAIVYGGSGILAMFIADRNLSKADRDAESKGYFRKRSDSDPPPSP